MDPDRLKDALTNLDDQLKACKITEDEYNHQKERLLQLNAQDTEDTSLPPQTDTQDSTPSKHPVYKPKETLTPQEMRRRRIAKLEAEAAKAKEDKVKEKEVEVKEAEVEVMEEDKGSRDKAGSVRLDVKREQRSATPPVERVRSSSPLLKVRDDRSVRTPSPGGRRAGSPLARSPGFMDQGKWEDFVVKDIFGVVLKDVAVCFVVFVDV